MKLHNYEFKTMGSPCQLKLYGTDISLLDQIAQKVKLELYRLNDRYTRYADTSLTSEINNNAGTNTPTAVDEETVAILQYADACFVESDGVFDITSGILRKAWDFKSNQLPKTELIEEILPNIGWDKVEWDDTSIYLPNAEMEIDFGGVVKEYAADKAGNLCRKMGVDFGLVDLGGDIHVIGPHPDGRPWMVGIEHPREKDGVLAAIPISRGGVASSGDYERFMIIDGKRYCHILNPKTGWPVEYYSAVSIVADHCVVAGSACTIAMLKGEQGEAWLESLDTPYISMDTQGNLNGKFRDNDPGIEHKPLR